MAIILILLVLGCGVDGGSLAGRCNWRLGKGCGAFAFNESFLRRGFCELAG